MSCSGDGKQRRQGAGDHVLVDAYENQTRPCLLLPSCLMPVALEHLAHAPSPAPLTDAAGLRPILDAVPDGRDRKGRLYPLTALLAAAAAAVLAAAHAPWPRSASGSRTHHAGPWAPSASLRIP